MYHTEFSSVYLHNTYGHGAFVCRVLHANSSSWQHQNKVQCTLHSSIVVYVSWLKSKFPCACCLLVAALSTPLLTLLSTRFCHIS